MVAAKNVGKDGVRPEGEVGVNRIATTKQVEE